MSDKAYWPRGLVLDPGGHYDRVHEGEADTVPQGRVSLQGTWEYGFSFLLYSPYVCVIIRIISGGFRYSNERWRSCSLSDTFRDTNPNNNGRSSRLLTTNLINQRCFKRWSTHEANIFGFSAEYLKLPDVTVRPSPQKRRLDSATETESPLKRVYVIHSDSTESE